MLFLKNIFFTLLVPGTIAVLFPLLILDGNIEFIGNTVPFSVLLMLIGFYIYCWCVWDFYKYGKGTPFPYDAPKILVIRGLYSYSRNPMYMGVLLFIIGMAVISLSIFLLLYVFIVMFSFQLIIIFYEEPGLQKIFGHDYTNYCRLVGRWFPVDFLSGKIR
jgi:protein-S-isoprenylcysteine O-methyltransferase Ste14